MTERVNSLIAKFRANFRGLDAQRQALEAGAKTTGCTVHYVNEDLDAGEIILQREVPVLAGDTVESLSERILKHEHPSYVEAVKRIVMDKLRDTAAGGS